MQYNSLQLCSEIGAIKTGRPRRRAGQDDPKRQRKDKNNVAKHTERADKSQNLKIRSRETQMGIIREVDIR